MLCGYVNIAIEEIWYLPKLALLERFMFTILCNKSSGNLESKGFRSKLGNCSQVTDYLRLLSGSCRKVTLPYCTVLSTATISVPLISDNTWQLRIYSQEDYIKHRKVGGSDMPWGDTLVTITTKIEGETSHRSVTKRRTYYKLTPTKP